MSKSMDQLLYETNDHFKLLIALTLEQCNVLHDAFLQKVKLLAQPQQVVEVEVPKDKEELPLICDLPPSPVEEALKQQVAKRTRESRIINEPDWAAMDEAFDEQLKQSAAKRAHLRRSSPAVAADPDTA